MKRLLFVVCFLFSVSVEASESSGAHGLSVFGHLDLPQGFKHFPYVNPVAPKGGRLSSTGTSIRVPNGSPLLFDSLNGYILKGNGAQGLELLFDSLMVRSFDESDAVYGLVAKSVTVLGGRAIFMLRGRARFADGSTLRAADVVFSLRLLRDKAHPFIRLILQDLKSVRVLGQHKVLVEIKSSVKKQTQQRNFFILLSQLPIFSKAYYQRVDFTKTTLKPPLGSGPYVVKKFKAGRFIAYARNKSYWARDLAVNRGRWNFDELRFEYFRDRTSEFEAFKSNVYDLREEYTSKVWARQYDFPAVRQGRVRRLVLDDKTPSGAQGWFINTRREKFKDVRVRQALTYAFDFEWTNRNQFYGQYQRTESFFENTALKAQGKPSAAVVSLLEPFVGGLSKAGLPTAGLPTAGLPTAGLPTAGLLQAALGEAVRPPRSNGSGQDRALLRRAGALLTEAGWVVKNGVRQKKGTPLTITFMNDQPSFQRIIQPFVKNLKLLGIDAQLQQVDAAQYQQRLRAFDFDLTTRRLVLPLTPGIGLRNFFSSKMALVAGSQNLSGVAHPAVDDLVERVVNAPTRKQQRVAASALDRVLRALHVWVPQWFNNKHHLAYWDKFDRPVRKPLYARGVVDTWWQKEQAQ